MSPTLLLISLVALPLVLFLASAGCEPFEVEPSPPVPYATMITATKSLRGYWRLAEAKGALKAVDSSNFHDKIGDYKNFADPIGFGRPGVLQFMGEPTDVAVEFLEGSNAYIEINELSMLRTPEFTAECWIAPQGQGATGQVIFGCYGLKPGTTIMSAGWAIGIKREAVGDAPTISADLRGDSDTISLRAKIDPDQGNGSWHHIVLTHTVRGGGVTTLYVDGQKAHALAGTWVANKEEARPMRLAAGLLDSSEGRPAGFLYRGLLDEVAFYAAALSADEVAKHFNHRLL